MSRPCWRAGLIGAIRVWRVDHDPDTGNGLTFRNDEFVNYHGVLPAGEVARHCIDLSASDPEPPGPEKRHYDEEP